MHAAAKRSQGARANNSPHIYMHGDTAPPQGRHAYARRAHRRPVQGGADGAQQAAALAVVRQRQRARAARGQRRAHRKQAGAQRERRARRGARARRGHHRALRGRAAQPARELGRQPASFGRLVCGRHALQQRRRDAVGR